MRARRGTCAKEQGQRGKLATEDHNDQLSENNLSLVDHSVERRLLFPSLSYYLDDSHPDIVILRRQDDSLVAAFSARGATKEGIIEAAKEDYGELIREQGA
jgi:hypothetical protein